MRIAIVTDSWTLQENSLVNILKDGTAVLSSIACLP